jgi:hypothetical protein
LTKKSSGVKSGDVGGQAVGPPLPTQRPRNVSSRNVVTFLWKLGFFAWGFIKDVVYSRKFRDLADLRQRIIEAVELITRHMLINT